MKSITISIYYDDGQIPEDITFDSIVKGGKVTAIAAYDLFETMEIAEAALESSNDEICFEAMKKIHQIINKLK